MAATSSPGKVAADPRLPSLDLACPRLDSTEAGGAVARRDGGGVADDKGGRCEMAREAGTQVAEGGTCEVAPTVTPSPAAKAARREPACEARMREAVPTVPLSGHAPFEGVLGENPACYSKIGDIDACGDVSSLEVLPR
uniref:Uncharacterized protein n=1 Tax=Oryza glaberrima TaxID=4538 RepID=I1P0D5_ORYGL